MPDLRSSIVARVHENEEDAKEKARIAEAEKNAPLFATLKRLDDLAQNPDFLWFVETYLAPIEAREQTEANDVKKRSKDQRDNSAHRLDVVKEITGKVEKERSRLSNQLYPK